MLDVQRDAWWHDLPNTPPVPHGSSIDLGQGVQRLVIEERAYGVRPASLKERSWTQNCIGYMWLSQIENLN